MLGESDSGLTVTRFVLLLTEVLANVVLLHHVVSTSIDFEPTLVLADSSHEDHGSAYSDDPKQHAAI